jgi:hypothetical protein
MSEVAEDRRMRQGGCRCGAVRYEVRGEPTKVGVCHCNDCRRETGSAFVWYADWPRQAFTATGAFRTYAGRSFCPGCGSRLFHLSENEAEIMLGSLEDPSGLQPTREGWIVRRAGWLSPIEGAGQHDRDPS